MAELQVAHTSDLDPTVLEAARALLEDAFAGDLEADDWEHALGGMHALLREDGELVGHASVVQRRLVHGGRALRTGYVEGVAVRPDRRRRGHGVVLMRAVEQVVRGAYDLGALGTSEDGVALYRACGWEPWRGPTAALTPDGVVRTPDEDGGIWVLRATAPLDLDGELACDFRDGSLW